MATGDQELPKDVVEEVSTNIDRQAPMVAVVQKLLRFKLIVSYDGTRFKGFQRVSFCNGQTA